MQMGAGPGTADGGNRGVLFVHGVGDQRKSDTLLDQGDPLFGWLWRWFRAFGSTVRVGRVELSFAPVDVGPADVPPWGRLELPGRRWSMAEVWWAASDRPPDLATMLGWSFRHLGDIIAQLWRNVLQRVDRLLHEDLQEHPTQPSRWWVPMLSFRTMCCEALDRAPRNTISRSFMTARTHRQRSITPRSCAPSRQPVPTPCCSRPIRPIPSAWCARPPN